MTPLGISLVLPVAGESNDRVALENLESEQAHRLTVTKKSTQNVSFKRLKTVKQDKEARINKVNKFTLQQHASYNNYLLSFTEKFMCFSLCKHVSSQHVLC